MSEEYTVGQKVYVYETYQHREPEVGEVVKVGRTLVHLVTRFGGVQKFYMDTGYGHGDYGSHARIETEARRAERERVESLTARLRAAGYEALRSHTPTADELERVVIAAEGGDA